MFKASLDYKRERPCHQKKAKKQNRRPEITTQTGKPEMYKQNNSLRISSWHVFFFFPCSVTWDFLVKDNTVITDPVKFEGSLESDRTVGKAVSRI